MWRELKSLLSKKNNDMNRTLITPSSNRYIRRSTHILPGARMGADIFWIRDYSIGIDRDL